MKLQPSRIHYSQNLLLNHQNAFSIFSSTKFHNIGHNAGSTTKIGGNFPKLQVFKKDGCYFALDNNSLSFYRQMELSKQNIENYTIDVVIVSSKKIPKAVLDGSACSADEGSSSSVSDTGEEESDTESDDFPRDSDIENSSFDNTTCLACGQRFRCVQELTHHQTTKKHFGCFMCDDVYPTSSELKTHVDSKKHHNADSSSESD